VCRPKHVEQLRNIGIINSTTRTNLVGYFYIIYPWNSFIIKEKMCSLWGIRRGWRNSWESKVVCNYDGVICEVRNQVNDTLWRRTSNMIFSRSQVSTFKSYRLRFYPLAISRWWSKSYLLVMYLEITVRVKILSVFLQIIHEFNS